jgi:hypothetical protein
MMSGKKHKRGGDRDRIADHRRTSPCKTSCLNLGVTPRASTSRATTATKLPDREPRKFLPSQQQIMALLSRAVVPEERREFERRFRGVATAVDDSGEHQNAACVGKTPLNWISTAYECEYPSQLQHVGEMFPNSGTESEFLDEFYIMDVILNRCPYLDGGAPPPTLDEGEAEDCVRLVRSYKPEDDTDKNDYKFRAMVLFLPQCGVFYCARERRDERVGVPKSLVPLDMSWLRLERGEGPGRSVSYTFGEGGYVKRFHQQHVSEMIPEKCSVSAWRILRRRTFDFRQNRVIYRVKQCSDSDGPMLAPDVFCGEDCGSWPHADLAALYNEKLACATSARKDGRHYAPSCHHYQMPETCLIIDTERMNNVDLMVDAAKIGQFINRQSVVMIRNVMVVDSEEDRESIRYHEDWDADTHLIGALNSITFHNEVLRRRSSKGGARAKGKDVGTMHALGTHVDLGAGSSTRPYAANGFVPERLLRQMVVSLSQIGRHCFPQVYAVVRDLESDSGLSPVPPMDGAADYHANKNDNNSSDDDDDSNNGEEGDGVVTANVWADAQAALKRAHRDYVCKKLKKRIRMLECRRRVGYTIDMSVNLGNSSHYDVHDASQGFSVWTEEIRGRGANWYFVMPNLHGTRPDGRPFAGVAIKLGHGVAISWDGRVIRHCTSLSMPDGIDGARVGEGKKRFKNHLYGTFTAAKERVVQAGRLQSAAAAASQPVPTPLTMDSGDDLCNGCCDGIPTTKGRTRRRCRKKRRRRGGSAVTYVADVANVRAVGGGASVEEFAVSPHHVEVLQNRVPEVGNVDASTTAGVLCFAP